MSLHRRNPKRDASEPGIIQVLEQLGAKVVKHSGPGEPDLIVGWRGLDRWVEVKTPGAKATGKKKRATKAGQVGFAQTWTGAPVALLCTPDEAIAWLMSLRKAAAREAAVSNHHHEATKALKDL